MKKSDLLKAVIAKRNEPVISVAASRRILAGIAKEPEPVFAWLFVNYDLVLEARTDLLSHLTWISIAMIAAADGVLGSRGAPPNANSMRRVWPRVCEAQARREARKAASGGKRTGA